MLGKDYFYNKKYGYWLLPRSKFSPQQSHKLIKIGFKRELEIDLINTSF